jgi:hypothetical protein
MTLWSEFASAAPEIAAYGLQRLNGRVAYLGTVRENGRPRVHPVTPIISDQRLFIFMEPTSPKGRDLEREGHYVLHCSVEDSSGGQGEFYVRGMAERLDDARSRQEAIAASSYTPQERYIMFTLSIEYAFMNLYTDDGSDTKRWQAP